MEWRRIKGTGKPPDGSSPGKKRQCDNKGSNLDQSGARGGKWGWNHDHKRHAGANQSNRQRKEDFKPICWNCGEEGHKKPNCPKPQDGEGTKFKPNQPEKGKGRKG